MQAGSVCGQCIQQVANCQRVCGMPDACLLHARKGCICSVQLTQLAELQDDCTPACAARSHALSLQKRLQRHGDGAHHVTAHSPQLGLAQAADSWQCDSSWCRPDVKDALRVQTAVGTSQLEAEQVAALAPPGRMDRG